MKSFIKEKIRLNLNELSTREKKPFGYGFEHNIYSSKSNPNVLYKVGDESIVSKWSKVFQSNPNLFPKVYKVGKLPSGKSYVEIEKLNTQPVVNEWGILDKELDAAGVLDREDYIDSVDVVFKNIVLGYMSYNGVLKKLVTKPETLNLFKKWVTFLNSASKYIQKFGYDALDIHRHNYAYDNAGNIKAIDI